MRKALRTWRHQDDRIIIYPGGDISTHYSISRGGYIHSLQYIHRIYRQYIQSISQNIDLCPSPGTGRGSASCIVVYNASCIDIPRMISGPLHLDPDPPANLPTYSPQPACLRSPVYPSTCPFDLLFRLSACLSDSVCLLVPIFVVVGRRVQT